MGTCPCGWITGVLRAGVSIIARLLLGDLADLVVLDLGDVHRTIDRHRDSPGLPELGGQRRAVEIALLRASESVDEAIGRHGADLVIVAIGDVEQSTKESDTARIAQLGAFALAVEISLA